MILKIHDGEQMVQITPNQLQAYARLGVYVYCGAGDDCVHLWYFLGPDPVPTSQQLLLTILRDVPHASDEPGGP